jgi:hypothetical protein
LATPDDKYVLSKIIKIKYVFHSKKSKINCIKTAEGDEEGAR